MKFLLLMLPALLYANLNYSLYTDKKGKQVGDLITVIIMENAKAKNDSRTKTRTSTDVDIAGKSGKDLFDWIPDWGFLSKNEADFDGKGNTERRGEFEATISVRITKVFDNGNLLIEGSKEVTLNSETETIRLSGLIRPDDISSTNKVMSYKIADAMIEYSGNGVLDDAQQPGLLSRFFTWLF